MIEEPIGDYPQAISFPAVVQIPKREINSLTLIDDALQRGMSIEIIRELRSMRDEDRRYEARKRFEAAYAAAKAKIPVVFKNRRVGFVTRKQPGEKTSWRYADLGAIVSVVAPLLAEQQLTHRFETKFESQLITVTCVIAHADGYSISNSLPAPPDTTGSKNTIQAINSTITYLQRITLSASLGIATTEDDDATSLDAISGEQLNTLTERLQASGLKERRFKDRFFGEDNTEATLADLPAVRFKEAMEAIDQYEIEKAKLAKEARDAEQRAASGNA